MTARYFTANVHGDQVIVLSGPHPTHDAAMQPHVDRLAAGGTLSGHWTPTVLLDPASLADPDTDLQRVLLTDPALHAIYELGRQQGRGSDAPPDLMANLIVSLGLPARSAPLAPAECCASGSCEVCTPGSGWSQ